MAQTHLLALLLFSLSYLDAAYSFVAPQSLRNGSIKINREGSALTSSRRSNNDEDKFSPQQRLESVKTGVLGALAGGIAATPFIAFHDIPAYGLASWEFDTDMGAIEAALFAIVYRYCVRKKDNNDMLNMGVIGAFVVVRTLSRVRVPGYCTAAPLDCGDPIGYFDWNMIQQLTLNGLESVALFGAAAAAMEVAYDRKWIGKFPN
ncbi:hypothetical protein ACHAWO_001948 [Cyclotella atomus]|uniref:Uncharacterized protein n=1 Tax=Cyclotella atomus TaxID=382360 RepID=A0ABD3NN04_9STRA